MNPILGHEVDHDTPANISVDSEVTPDVPLISSTPVLLDCAPQPSAPPAVPQLNDILTDYHPSSNITSKVQPLHEYGHQTFLRPIPEKRPWEPFRTRLDFEVAELALEAALNRSQIDCLAALLHRVAAKNTDEDVFTIKNSKDMKEIWELASAKRTGVISCQTSYLLY